MSRRRSDRRGHAVVTGGSSGIGLAVATRLSARGHPVTLIARGAEQLAAAAALIADTTGNRPGWTAADVADQPALAEAILRATDERGPVEVLIAAAGTVRPGALSVLDDAEFRRQMDVNFFGALYAVRAVYPAMAARGAGNIVVVASAAALIGIYGYTAYAASKFALRGFAEALRSEARADGVTISIAYPGDTDTPQLAAEMAVRPPETTAIAGGGGLSDPAAVAAAIVRGMDRGSFAIYPGARTAALGRTASLIAPVLQGRFDATIRRLRRTERSARGASRKG